MYFTPDVSLASDVTKLQALLCDHCGSEFFYAVELHRYSANAYSEIAGGDLHVIDHPTAQAIRICICGRPVVPVISGGRMGYGAGNTRKLVGTVQAAIEAQQKGTADLEAVTVDMGVLTAGAVTKRELQEFEKRIMAGIEDRIAALLAPLKQIEENAAPQKNEAADAGPLTRGMHKKSNGRSGKG